jgi:hypothetical protein
MSSLQTQCDRTAAFLFGLLPSLLDSFETFRILI